MAWMDAIGAIVNRYGSAGGAATAPADPHQDYCSIAQSAPQQVMADALAHTFRSEQTPAFPDMVSKLFQQSSPDQRAGLLNHLLGTLGPSALAGAPALEAIAGKFIGGQSVTSRQAADVPSEQVHQMANRAIRTNPSIVDQVSGFYAKHPDVVKGLGGAAIMLAIRHMIHRS